MSLTRQEVIKQLGIDFVNKIENAPEVNEADLPLLLRCDPSDPYQVKEIKNYISSGRSNTYFTLMTRHNFSKGLATPEYFELLSFHNMSVGLCEFNQNFSNLAHWIIENYQDIKHSAGAQYISKGIRKAIASYVSDTYASDDEKLVGFSGEADMKYLLTHKVVHEDSDLSNIPNSAFANTEFVELIIKHFSSKSSEDYVEYSVVDKFVNNAHLVTDVKLSLQLIQSLYMFTEVHYIYLQNSYMLKIDDSHIYQLVEMPNLIEAYIIGTLANSDFSTIPNNVIRYAAVYSSSDFVKDMWLQANTSKDQFLRENYVCDPEFNIPPVQFKLSDVQNRFNNTGKVNFDHLRYANCTGDELTNFIINNVKETEITEHFKNLIQDCDTTTCLAYIRSNELKIKLIQKFPALYTYFVQE